MKDKLRKILSILLSLQMLITSLPTSALAAGLEQVIDTQGGQQYFAAVPYADSNSYEVKVGETLKEIEGNGSYDHKWSQKSEDGGSVIISPETGSASVSITGKSVGKVTLTHTYRTNRGNSRTQTFTVTVTAAAELPTGTHTVYMYTHVDGDTTGLVLDGGYYTVGKVVVDGIPTAQQVLDALGKTFNANTRYEDGQPYEQTVIDTIKSGAYTPYTPNAQVLTSEIVKNGIDWTGGAENSGLCPSNGAAGYNEDVDPDNPGKQVKESLQWHIDGYLHINYKYFVRHWIESEDGTWVDIADGRYTQYGDASFVTFDETSDEVVTDNEVQIKIPGYTFKDTDSQITLNRSNQTLNVYYKKSEFNVSYQYEGTVPAGAPAVPATKTATSGTTVTVEPVPTLTGYTFDGWYKDGQKVTGFTMPTNNVVLTGRWTRNEYTVTYNRGANGMLADENKDGNVVHSGLHYGDNTPVAPAVTPGDGYYFTGWAPVVAPTVTGDETYVAQYAPKSVLTVTVKDKTTTYNGTKQSGYTIPTKVQLNNAVTDEYTITGLKDGHKVVVDAYTPAEGTDVGTYDNAVFGAVKVVDADGNDVTEQYAVTTNKGTLTITPVTDEVIVTIVGNHDSKVYDGEAHEVTGYAVESISNPLYAEADFTFNGTASANRTEVGTTNMGLTVEQFVNKNENFDKVTFVVTDGYMTITKRPVTIRINSNDPAYAYDGYAYTVAGRASDNKPEYTVDAATDTTGLATDHEETLNVVYDGAENRTLVGAYDATADENGVTISDAKGNDVTENYAITLVPGLLTITDESVDPNLVVTKKHDTTKKYDINSMVEFTIEVTNIYNAPKTITITEQEGVKITGNSVFENVPAGESRTTTAEYTITEADIINGEFVNEVTASFSDGLTAKNTDTVPTEPVRVALEKTKVTLGVTNDNGVTYTEKKEYAPGDTIWYRITVKNTGNVAYTNVSVDDMLTAEKHWTIDYLAANDEWSVNAAYTVQESDVLKGTVANYAAVSGGTVPTPAPSSSPRPTPVPTATPNPSPTPDTTDKIVDLDTTLTVTKTTLGVARDEGGYEAKAEYKLGDTIHYSIEVENKGNVAFEHVEVNDPLTGESWTIESLPVGTKESFETAYTVTEADIIAGHVLNEATAKADPITGPNGPQTPEGEDKTDDNTDPWRAELTKTKITLGVKTGEENGVSIYDKKNTYALGDTIWYQITVKNTGNVTYTNADVVDELTGDAWTVTLAPGASQDFTTSYTVDEEDLLKGQVANYAAVSGGDVPTPAPTATPGPGVTPRPTPVPTVTPNPSQGPTPEPTPDTTDDTDEPNPSFTVEKTLTNLPEKGYFTVGETAEFDIVVENNGNLTLNDIAVNEELEGAIILEGEGYEVAGNTATIATLAPGKNGARGESVTIKATYTVTADDLSTELANIVTATGKGPEDPEDPTKTVDPDDERDEEDIPTDEAVKIAGVKQWNDADNLYATRPETITLRLTADEQEIGSTQASADTAWAYSFAKLPAHTADGAEITYSVTEDAVPGYDAVYAQDSNDITNNLRRHTLTVRYWYGTVGGETAAPTVRNTYAYGESYSVATPGITGYAPSTWRVTGIIDGDVEYDVVYTLNRYNLTVRYLYANGAVAAPEYVGSLSYGDVYSLESPELEGYIASHAVIAGTMPGRDLVYTVIYVSDTVEVIIDEYGVPLGIGNVEMNVGDCFE